MNCHPSDTWQVKKHHHYPPYWLIFLNERKKWEREEDK
jgi:hypothetical protein